MNNKCELHNPIIVVFSFMLRLYTRMFLHSLTFRLFGYLLLKSKHGRSLIHTYENIYIYIPLTAKKAKDDDDVKFSWRKADGLLSCKR